MVLFADKFFKDQDFVRIFRREGMKNRKQKKPRPPPASAEMSQIESSKPLDQTVLDWFEHQAQNASKNNQLDTLSDTEEYFIENIGVINPAKMTRILESYYSKAYVITAIEKVDNA